MEEKYVTIITLLVLAILFCSNGYCSDCHSDCPYTSTTEGLPFTTCNPKKFDCKLFQEDIDRYLEKLKPFYEKIESEQSLSDNEALAGMEIVNKYYTRLISIDILYGNLAKDVANNKGPFARLANVHLEHRAEVEGKSSQIKDIKNNIPIALAYMDARLRSVCKQFVPYRAIADYHYTTFEKQGLSKYAWGGTFLEEFAGTGSWMNACGYDTENVKFDGMELIRALYSDEEVNGVNAQEALKSIMHIPLQNLKDSCLAVLERVLGKPTDKPRKRRSNSFFAPNGQVYQYSVI